MDREGVDFAKALSGPSPAEKWDAADDVEAKTRQLAELFREAKGRIVVFTGAGSTSSGIPARVRGLAQRENSPREPGRTTGLRWVRAAGPGVRTLRDEKDRRARRRRRGGGEEEEEDRGARRRRRPDLRRRRPRPTRPPALWRGVRRTVPHRTSTTIGQGYRIKSSSSTATFVDRCGRCGRRFADARAAPAPCRRTDAQEDAADRSLCSPPLLPPAQTSILRGRGDEGPPLGHDRQLWRTADRATPRPSR